MCGIVGYIGHREAPALLLTGLRRLEYRGYDSAGLATLEGGEIQIRRCEGKLHNLEREIAERPCRGPIGIGHTRWATHGRPSEINAHPHRAGDVVVVHNGIIENYLALREELQSRGRTFSSETDTEIVSHLIDEKIAEGLDFPSAVRAALSKIDGSYAIAALCNSEPGQLIGAKQSSPLVVGLGEGENFIASDIPALLEHTRRVVFLEDGEMAVVRADAVEITDLEGKAVHRESRTIEWTLLMAEKGGYKHFMLKEIFEQPRAVTDTVRGRVSGAADGIYLDGPGLSAETFDGIGRVGIVACGTSYHAALVGKFMIEALSAVPVEVDLASEFRYRDPLVGEDTLLVTISQSGETADTIAALEEGRRKGARVLSICNVVDSSIARKSDAVLYTHAGPEISVASTKAFTTQLTALYLLGLQLGSARGRLEPERLKELIGDILHLPHLMDEVLGQDGRIQEIARRYFHATDFLYLGRGINYPIALEGALKLKEISYIHAEGYPAGEMKHGPIALIDESLPVVVVVPEGKTYEKILGNIEEVRARKGDVIALVTQGDEVAPARADAVIEIPRTSEFLTPVLMALPLQLLAYHIAVLKGTDVDQPRNLAKSVTVE